jgi:predicted RNase H-like nuclease (RuvC/YqgF family)
MDDAFLELEQQLANITRGTFTPSTVAKAAPPPSSTSNKEVEQLKAKLKEEQQAREKLEQKLVQLAEAAKE